MSTSETAEKNDLLSLLFPHDENPERIESSQYHVTQSAAFFCSASSLRRGALPLLNAVKNLNHHLGTSAYLCHISKGKKGIASRALDRRRQESNGIKSWTINIPVLSDMSINIGLLIFTRSLSLTFQCFLCKYFHFVRYHKSKDFSVLVYVLQETTLINY